MVLSFENFEIEAKVVYPDWAELHFALENGDYYYVRMLLRRHEPIVSARQIWDLWERNELDELKSIIVQAITKHNKLLVMIDKLLEHSSTSVKQGIL